MEKSKAHHPAHQPCATTSSWACPSLTAACVSTWRARSQPTGAQTDGRVWRIKVGNRPLDTAKLTMMGGGAVVGEHPAGPAHPVHAPSWTWGVGLQLFPYAIIISLLGFMEAISIAKAMAAKTGQRLDPNQELIGQGLANIIGCLGKSYPVSGSFSRSAVNLQAGAFTGLSSVVTSLMVVIVLLFFTPLLYNLPQAVLAAVIMMAVVGLINVTGFVHAWRAQWYDGAISIITFICTLAYAPHLDKGIMIGVVLSLLMFLYKSMRPKVAALAMHNGLRPARRRALPAAPVRARGGDPLRRTLVLRQRQFPGGPDRRENPPHAQPEAYTGGGQRHQRHRRLGRGGLVAGHRPGAQRRLRHKLLPHQGGGDGGDAAHPPCWPRSGKITCLSPGGQRHRRHPRVRRTGTSREESCPLDVGLPAGTKSTWAREHKS